MDISYRATLVIASIIAKAASLSNMGVYGGWVGVCLQAVTVSALYPWNLILSQLGWNRSGTGVTLILILIPV